MTDLGRDGDVWILRMTAGENRFTQDWLDAVRAALDQVEAAPGPAALVTTGQGRFYTNGLDLDWLAARGDAAARFLASLTRLLGRLVTFPVPTVAAVNGTRSGRARCWRSRTISWSCGKTGATGACPRPTWACR